MAFAVGFMTNHPTPASELSVPVPTAHALALFVRLSRLEALAELLRRFGYLRCWSPGVTLMAMIPGHLIGRGSTLEKVLALMRSGAGDALGRAGKKLSLLLQSCTSTSAYARAGTRLPRCWLRRCLRAQAKDLRAMVTGWQWHGMEVRVLDGTMITLRPFGRIPRRYRPHRNQHGECSWCQMRVLACLCLGTGVILSLVIGSAADSEQARAVRLMLSGCCGGTPAAPATVLWMGDANFGVWRVVAASRQSGQHVLVRLTRTRARKLAGTTALRPGLDQAVIRERSSHDQMDRGLAGAGVAGRLLVVRLERRGFRPSPWLLFTTVEDRSLTPAELAGLYVRRWEIELTFRSVKAHRGLGELRARSPVMAKRELLTGVLACNPVRGVMLLGSATHSVALSRLSFAKAQEELAWALVIAGRGQGSAEAGGDWEAMILRVARGKVPRRRQPRPREPRRKRHRRETFPPLRGDRTAARLLAALADETLTDKS